jgi:hypothetical protein
MSVYRDHDEPRPPRAPWWRLVWHWRSLLRWRDRAWRQTYGIVHDPERWVEREKEAEHVRQVLLDARRRYGKAR